MNYLAHMAVGQWAGLDERGVLGNFMGDAVMGRDVEGMWGLDVGRGIRLHRAIDDVSDRQKASRKARKLLRELCGKWSGVVWDVLVDHVLAKDFERLAMGCGALTAFTRSHEAVLAAQRENMPERSRRFFDAMVSHGWLVGYRDPDIVEAVLLAMSRRRKTAGPVALGWEAFLKDEETLRGLGYDFVQHMERWGKEVNLVSLVPQHF